MSVTIGTTPTFTLTFSGTIDLTEAQNVYVTFVSGATRITKTGEDLTVQAKSIGVYLTQKETLSFSIGDVEIQANWTMANGSRAASEIAKYPITKQLLKKVLQ